MAISAKRRWRRCQTTADAQYLHQSCGRPSRRAINAKTPQRHRNRHIPCSRQVINALFDDDANSSNRDVVAEMNDEKRFRNRLIAHRAYDQVRANRFVFLTGKDDFSRGLTTNVYRKYQSAGLRNIHLMDILGMAHEAPGTRDFRKAINYLDDREQLYRLIAPKNRQLHHCPCHCGKKGLRARRSLHNPWGIQK